MRPRWVKGVLVTMLTVLMAGCGSSTAGTPQASAPVPVASVPQEIGPPPEPEVGTGGQLIAIQSDNVQAAGYEAGTGVMTVLFDSGGLYEYYDVPASLWESFLAAQPHPWSAVGDPQLVKGGYRYQRIG